MGRPVTREMDLLWGTSIQLMGMIQGMNFQICPSRGRADSITLPAARQAKLAGPNLNRIPGIMACMVNRQNPAAEAASIPFWKNTVSSGLPLGVWASMLITPTDSRRAR